MKFDQLLTWVADEPVFETGLLLAGDVNPLDVRKQLSRWVKAGKLLQLRRGLYALAPPYQRIIPHPFLLANRLQAGSTVSLQSALAHFGMIPEAVPTITSVTTGRAEFLQTPLGAFTFQHIKTAWQHSYRRIEFGRRQFAFVSDPEKALLDLVYLEKGGDQPVYLNSLRLQALDRLDIEKLQRLARDSGRPKLQRGADYLTRLTLEEKVYEIL
jgi:predicted transcriptional regulator of viral defense system